MVKTQIHNKYNKVLYYLSKINVFEDKESLSFTDQLLTTRIFIILITIALFILVLFTSLNPQTQTITIYSPSQIVIEKLSHQYPNTLSCPCSQTSIRQDQFLSFDPEYHPVCNSYLINQTFISSLSDPSMSEYYPVDYRLMIASHLQILALLCRTAKQSLLNTFQKFGRAQIITDRVLSIDGFNAQIDALVQQIRTTTIADIKYLSQFLSLIISQNQIYSALRTNYLIQTRKGVSGTPSGILVVIGYKTVNGICSCLDSNPCVSQARFYNMTDHASRKNGIIYGSPREDPPLLFIVPGIMCGCLPYDSLLQSTLQCFYSQSCLSQMAIYIHQLSSISPLTLSSRFQKNTTINDLFDNLFIESWNNKSNFSGYFHSCDPHSCTYSYDRRFNFLYTLVTFISFLGGLKLLLYLLAPLIVKLIRRIQKLKCCFKKREETTRTEIEEEQKESIKDRLCTKIHKLYRRLITLNLFPTSPTIEDGIYSTRVFLLFLIIGILVLVFYASISVRIHSVTVYHPSIDQFEQLNDQYSSTLVCPCTELSVAYSSIIHIKPNYHQVCSSDFVNNKQWLGYFQNTGGHLYFNDFRLTGYSLFSLLTLLCRMSNETVMNELAVFNDMKFVSTRTLTRKTFDAQTLPLIHQFEQQTISSFLSLFDLVRASVQLNQFIISDVLNAKYGIFIHGARRSIQFRSKTEWSETCSCGTNSSCSRSQGFYCRAPDYCKSINRPNQTIPGLVTCCLPVDSLLLSTFECFYNSSCIQMLSEWRTFGTEAGSIPPWSMNLTALNSKKQSRFLPDTTFQIIVSQLFIDDWINSTDFVSYYNQCSPNECTYSFIQGYNTIHVISTVFGLFGGLAAFLRIFVPPITQLIRRLCLYYRRRYQQATTETHQQSPIHHRMFIFATYIRHSIMTMNVYKITTKRQTTEEEVEEEEQQPTSTERELLRNQQIATRIYFLLFICSLFIILLFTGLDRELNSITIPSPSESTFEQLQSEYSSTLSCPCSQVAIQYSKVLSLIPSSYHQICSSRFISFGFITELWGSELSTNYYTQPDLKLLSTYFRLLSSFCSLAKNEIEDKIKIFNSNEFISIETSTRISFQSQVDSIIQSFIDQALAGFRQRHTYIIDTFHANQLHTMFLTNWNVSLTTAEEDYFLATHPVVYEDISESCSCATSSACSRQLVFNLKTQRLTLPGLVVGCLPIHGLRLSTLECFYNSSCVTELFLARSISTVSYPILNSNSPTRFTPVSSTLIGTLIDELFIESWQSSSNYSTYYSTCAPSTCRYTYVKKNDVIYMLTTFLGLYGGLTIGIKFIVWYGLYIYRKLCRCVVIHSHVVEPIDDSKRKSKGATHILDTPIDETFDAMLESATKEN